MIYFWWFQLPRWVFVRCGGVGLLNMTFLYAECLQTLCRIYVPYRLSTSPAVAIAFMLEEARKEARRSRCLSPSLASLSPCWCREGRTYVDLAVGSISMKQGLSLAHVKPTWLLSWPVHAQGAEGCRMLPVSSPGTCRAWWPHESCSRPSHPSPGYLHFGFELAWVRELQGLDMGGKPGRWRSCLT